MSAEQDRKLERLLDLLLALLDASAPLGRQELQRRMPEGLYPADDVASRRAFSRDVEALVGMGVPIEVQDGQVPTYRVRREAYELPDPGLDEEEAAALHLALATVELDLPQGSPAEALWKVAGGAPSRITAPSSPVATLPGHEHLGVVWAALHERRAVRFRYRDEDREVEPWQLSCQRGHWYLRGHDRTRGEERLFRVDRVQGSVAPTGEPGSFERPAGGSAAPPPPWLLGETVAFTARLWVDAGHAAWAEAQGGSSVEERRDDGSVVLALPVANPEALRSFALSLLDHAELLSPPEARADLVAWLEAVAS